MALIRSQAVTLTIFVTVLLVLFTPSYGSRGGRIVGARKDMGDVEGNKEVQELGRYSVDKYNERIRLRRNDNVEEKVELTKVVEAKKQVVSGIKYYLKIRATQNGSYKMFDSVVAVKPWLHTKQLLSFAPSDSDLMIGFVR